MSDKLFKRIESFEKLATYDSRSIFLSRAQDMMLNDNYHPQSNPQFGELASLTISSGDSDLVNLGQQLAEESEKTPLNLDLISKIVGQIVTNTQDNDEQPLHQKALQTYYKLQTPKATAPKVQKYDSTPKYNPVDSSKEIDQELAMGNRLADEARKLLADWRNPLNASNQNSLKEKSDKVISQLTNYFTLLKDKSESIQAVPSDSPEDQAKDKRALQDITLLQTTLYSLISELSTKGSGVAQQVALR